MIAEAIGDQINDHDFEFIGGGSAQSTTIRTASG
jgi:hypothetical protein